MKIETPIAKKKHRRIKSNSKNIDMAMDGGNIINDSFIVSFEALLIDRYPGTKDHISAWRNL